MIDKWLLTPLKNILTERRETPSAEDLASGRIRIIEKINFKTGLVHLRVDGSTRTGMILVQPGDLVVSGINAAKGAIAVYSPDSSEPVAATIHYGAYAPDLNRVDINFLWWLLRSRLFQGLLNQYVPGGIKTELKAKRLLPVPIPLPPLLEQRRVVARIEELSAKIQESRNLRNQAVEDADVLVSAVRAKLFEKKVGWQLMRVGDFCELPQYGFTASATDQPIGPRFLRITDIQEGKVEWESVPYCYCPEPSKYLLRPNDLVFARTGATTGKSFVIQECPEAVFASYLIRLRVKNAVTVDYLYQFFQSPRYWEQISDKKEGTGQPNLNGSKLAKLVVPVASLEEQRRIVAELDALQTEVDAMKRLQADSTAELDALLPSILDRAFKGEYSCPYKFI